MKAFLLLSISLLPVSKTIFAQQSSILKDFKFRNSNYRAVTLNFNANGAVSSSNNNPNKSKGQSSFGNIDLSYYTIKSTDRILRTVSGYLLTGFSFSKANNNINDKQKTRNGQFAANLNLNNKWFSDKRFIELGVGISSLSNSDKHIGISPISYEEKARYQDQILTITTGIGKGRLENISDMQNTLWLNKALEKENCLTRQLNNDELKELGRAITISNNTRILDARRRTRFILETIDNYFQQKGLVKKTDIKYFSNLNDILFFAFNDARVSGSEKFIRLTPGITYHNQANTKTNPSLKNESTSTVPSVQLSAGFSTHNPVNLQHQNDYGISSISKYSFANYKIRQYNANILTYEANSSPTILQTGINMFFQHSIYPNTRTSINFRINSEAGYQNVDKEDSFYGTVVLDNSLSYFISYRTRLNLNFSMRYNNNIYNTNNLLELIPQNFQLNLNAGVQINL